MVGPGFRDFRGWIGEDVEDDDDKNRRLRRLGGRGR